MNSEIVLPLPNVKLLYTACERPCKAEDIHESTKAQRALPLVIYYVLVLFLFGNWRNDQP